MNELCQDYTTNNKGKSLTFTNSHFYQLLHGGLLTRKKHTSI